MRSSWGQKALDTIERVGNRLPDPVTLFVIAIAILIAVSSLTAMAGVSAIHPGTGEVIQAVSLLGAERVLRLLTELPSIFASFPPLGLVLVIMMGVGVAERSGLIGASVDALVRATPARLLTPAIVFAGVQSSIATDAGFVVLTPLAALAFYSVGRHPLAGLAAAYAGAAGGFSSNLLVTSLDPLLSGISEMAAHLVDPGYEVQVTGNYYLMIALVPLLTLVGSWVTERVVEPRLNATVPLSEIRNPAAGADAAATKEGEPVAIAGDGRRGLRWAGLTLVGLTAILALLTIPETGLLRGEDGSVAPFLRSMVALLFLSFLLLGIAYGVGAGTVRSDRDVVRMMAGGMSDMGGYIVLALVAAVFIALFGWSNLGAILAIKGAAALKSAGFVGVPLMASVILVSALLNIVIGSASAKWAVLAPVLVPMMMLLGVTPEATQAAYRVGDSITNPITPLFLYFPLILIIAQRYAPRFGVGSLVAMMLPYALGFGVASTAFYCLWFGFDLPFGPGVGARLPVAVGG